MIGRLLAAKRAREAQKLPEVSVQKLNEQQKELQRQREIQEQQKEDFKKLHASCAIVFAASIILLIIAMIVLIPALTEGNEVFFVAFGGFTLSGVTLLLLGCCFNDCCKTDKDDDNSDNGFEETSISTSANGFKDSGISLAQSEALMQYYDEIPFNIPVRLEVPICAPLTVRNYYNLPSITT